MKTKVKNYEMDMCEGPLLAKMIKFTIPLILANALSLFYNAADTVVVGRFAGSEAMAAVGSTAYPIGLIVNLLGGMSMGTTVLVSRYFGAKKEKDIQETLHTSITFGMICGLAVSCFGILFSKMILLLMGTPEDVIDLAARYMKIYFLGTPASFFSGYGGASIRAVGDTKRPLIYGSISGMVNVLLNLLFVVGFHWSVAGVAWATVVSQYTAALMLFFRMIHLEGSCHLDLSKLHIHGDKLRQIVAIGVPMGVQSSLFSISNVLIQSTINSFGSAAMAGSSAAINLENFANVVMTTFGSSALSFASQNLGGGKYDRVSRVLKLSLALTVSSGLFFGLLVYSFKEPLLGIYTTDPEVINYGIRRMRWLCAPCVLTGIMTLFSSMLRGLGYGTLPMAVSVFGTCGLRILWIYTVFAWNPTWDVLMMGYPISWAITGGLHAVCYFVVWGKMKRNAVQAA